VIQMSALTERCRRRWRLGALDEGRAPL